MKYKINGITNAKDIITNNGIPTIFEIMGDSTGTKAKLEITIGGNRSNSAFYLTINDVTINSSFVISQVKNNVFYASNSTSYADNRAKAYYLAQALNSTSLSNTYDIYVDQTYVSTTLTKVIMIAKTTGTESNITNLSTNLETDLWKFTTTNGSSGDEICDSRITVDIYADSSSNQAAPISGQTQVPTQHIVQLEKYYGNEESVKFDLAPVLRTITDYSGTTQYRLIVSSLKNNTYRKLYDINSLFCINGYRVNRGVNYFQFPSNKNYILLHNFLRGNGTNYDNMGTLYFVPNEPLYLSVLSRKKETLRYTVNYLDSSYQTIYSDTGSTYGNKNVHNIKIYPGDNGAHYMTITIDGLGTYVFKNVLPVNYADPKDIQTIHWRNSYGGIGTFTFTGKKEEQEEVDRTTYTKSSLNYYSSSSPYPVHEEVLDVKTTYTVTVKSHLMDADARYQIHDLMNSRKVWTYHHDGEIDIIIDNIQETEVQRDVYEVTLTYHYATKNI